MTKQVADGFIRVMLVAPFVQHVSRLGVNLEPVLKSFGLTATMLRDLKATVHAEIVYGLCNDLADLAQNPHLGCRIAEQFDLASWPPFAAAGKNTRTVGEFLNSYLMRVPQEASSVHHSLIVEAHRATYQVQRLVATRNPPRQVDGFGVAMHLRLLGLAVGPAWEPKEVMVETAFPEALPRGYMGVRIARIEGQMKRVSFPPDWLLKPLQLGIARSASLETGKPDLSIIAALRGAARPLL